MRSVIFADMKKAKRSPPSEPLVLTVEDLMRLLPLGRAGAYALARKLGIRVGLRRILVPKARFDAWLASGRVDGA